MSRLRTQALSGQGEPFYGHRICRATSWIARLETAPTKFNGAVGNRAYQVRPRMKRDFGIQANRNSAVGNRAYQVRPRKPHDEDDSRICRDTSWIARLETAPTGFNGAVENRAYQVQSRKPYKKI